MLRRLAERLGRRQPTSAVRPYATVPGEVASCSGVPAATFQRKVNIFAPARSAAQQARGDSFWRIEFEQQERWANPLIGWTSTADPYAHTLNSALSFNTREAAIAYCTKFGFQFEVKEPNEMVTGRKPKAYSDNFKWKGPPK